MPITTTGRATSFIQFSRTSNATVTDSNGFIEWAGHNLLTHSESFDNAAWIASGTVIAAPTKVAANAVAAPNGTTTADEVSFPAVTGAGDVSILVQSFTNMPLVQHTAGIWVKAKAAGDIGKQIVLYSWTGVMAIKTHVTLDGTWQYVSASGTWTANNPNYAVGVIGSTYGGVNQGAVSVYLWGAHLYRSDLGGMVLNPARGDAYYPTTPRNLLGFTEDFSNAAWDKSSFGTSATSNTLIAPNGLQTADLITAINSTNNHLVYQSSGINLAASGVVTGSIYVKADTATFVRLGVVDNLSGADWAGFIVNLSTGAVTNTYTGANASNVTTHTPVSVGNGWYRVGITATLTASTNDLTFRVGPFNAASASPGNYFSVSWAAAGTESIYLWGAQLSDSASLDAYSPVYGAAVTSAAYYAPRLDFDPVTLAANGLLVEEQRTNLLQWSSDFRDTTDAGSSRPWIYNNVTVTPNDAVAPDGTMTADRINPSSNAAIYYQLTSPASATTWTFSIWLKSATGSSFSMPYYVNGSGANPTPQTGTLGTVTTQWQRFSVQVTTASSAATVNIALGNYSTGWASGNNVHAWGAQIDSVTGGNATFPTSYIPTNGATATRTADVASVSTQAFPYSASEGTIVVNATGRGSAPYLYAFAGSDNSGTNSLYTYGPTTYTTEAYNGGALQTNSNSGVATGTAIKVAAGYASNNFGVSVNGASVTPDTTYSQPSIDKLRIGSSANITVIGQVYVRQITYIPRRLTNAELVARST